MSATRIESGALAPFNRYQLTLMSAVMLGFFVVSLDALIVTVALPATGAEFGSGISGLQWIVTGYTLAFSALILFAGTLSDRIGARQAYVIGMIVFGVATMACGLAPGLLVLIGARVVQGAGAALVTPASLAMIREEFADSRQRARAIGLWALGGSVAAVAGPLLGGLLTMINWRMVYWVNLPVVAFALACAVRLHPSPRRSLPLDAVGQVLAITTLGALGYGVIEGPNLGWGSTQILTILGIATAAGLGFAGVQVAGKNSMIPHGLFASRELRVTLGIAFGSMASFYAMVFLITLFFQEHRGESPFTTGLLFLPMTVSVALLSWRSAWLANHFSRRTLIVAGTVSQLLGIVIIAVLPFDISTWITAAAMVLVGGGGAATVPPIAALVLDHAPVGASGAASSVLHTSRQLGSSLGIAAVGAVASSYLDFGTGLRIGLLATACLLLVTGLLACTIRPTLFPSAICPKGWSAPLLGRVSKP